MGAHDDLRTEGKRLNVEFAANSAKQGARFHEEDDRSGKRQRKSSGGKKIFIGNIAHKVEEDDLKDVCKEFGEVSEVKILRKKDGAPPCGFVTFCNIDEAEKAIGALNGKDHKMAAG